LRTDADMVTQCIFLGQQGKYPWCKKHEAYTSAVFCGLCAEQGPDYIGDLFARRDGKKDKSFSQKIIHRTSQALGRVAGGGIVSAVVLQRRQEVCFKCELLTKDEMGFWCGKPITQELRLGGEKKGCGCLLESKWKYKNFECPRKLWPVIAS